MPHEPIGDRFPPAAWWRARRDKLAILDLHEHDLLQLEEAALVDHLAEQLDRRLRQVLVELRHVDIVDEDQHLLPGGRPPGIAHEPLELVEEDVLDVLGGGLCTEVDDRGDEFVAGQVVQVILDDHTLPGSGFSVVQRVVPTLDQDLEQLLELDCVFSRDKDVEVRDRILGLNELLDLGGPLGEL